MSRARGRAMALFAALLLVTAGCASNDRPDAARWRLDWETLVNVVPDQAELGDPPSEELCRSTLADIRSQGEELLPSPTSSIDDLANAWISVAEEAFFDCPPEGQEIDSFQDAYDEMRRLEDSVAAALADAE